jgi:hypothetical protein
LCDSSDTAKALNVNEEEIDRGTERRAQVEDPPASWNTGSSLADRVRVLTPEEWARL